KVAPRRPFWPIRCLHRGYMARPTPARESAAQDSVRVRFDPGQEDLEGRPLSGLAPDENVPAALLDDPVDGRKAEPRSLVPLLRGEERLEDPLAGLLVHSHPGVAYGEHDPGAGARAELRRDASFAGAQLPRLDRERAAFRHRVAGVDGEIQDHLLEL